MDEQPPADGDPRAPAPQVGARRREAMSPVDVEQRDLAADVVERLLGEAADMAHALGDAGALQIGGERVMVGLAEPRPVAVLPRTAVAAEVGVDRHQLDAGGGRQGQHDRRTSAEASDLDDLRGGAQRTGDLPQPPRLGRRQPPGDRLNRRARPVPKRWRVDAHAVRPATSRARSRRRSCTGEVCAAETSTDR